MIKPIEGYEGKYEVTSDGHVFALNYHREGIRKEVVGTHDKDGYKQIGLRANGKRKYYRVHRLIAQAFLPNPDNLSQINHKNGVKDDNTLDNLEWVTPKQNIQHAWENLSWEKRDQKGSANNNAVVTEDIVKQIWSLKGTQTQKSIALLFGISEDVVSMIHRQVTWRHITEKL